MKIEKETLSFLNQLKENNNREWFQENKALYDAAVANVKAFITELIAELSQIDPHINTDIQASRCLFRIYRDIRFSKDKTPYKTWFSAGISIDGRKLDGPEYYFHIEPGNNFFAAGYWRPDKAHLEFIRQEIDYSSNELVEALARGGYTVADLSEEDKLKRPPAGYDAENPNIELLKLKSFIVYDKFTDIEITGAEGLKRLIDTAMRVNPFKQFIHQAIDQ